MLGVAPSSRSLLRRGALHPRHAAASRAAPGPKAFAAAASRTLVSRAAAGPKAFAAEERAAAKAAASAGIGAPSYTQLANRYLLSFGSLLAGASVVHLTFMPDLTIPQLQDGASPHDCGEPSTDGGEDFIPTATFRGARPGMVYKLGRAGLGYYPDRARSR
mmetsp:Transcript_28346/g.90003  ORF Transcript_28346/g.90003 Transcript_28346/m.90003 type:complete len:161 (-) Transcript_28346:239-721(-)